jgi:hypothetical protein
MGKRKESAEERKRRLESILFPEALLKEMEREVEELETSVERGPVPIVPARKKTEKDMTEEEKAEKAWVEATRRSSLKTGLLMAIVAWLGVGGWTGYGCYGCTEGGNAVFGAIGFVLVGVLSAFLIGIATASIAAFSASMKKAGSFDDATDLYEEICWGEEEIAVASIIISIIGCLLAIGVVVGALFSLF